MPSSRSRSIATGAVPWRITYSPLSGNASPVQRFPVGDRAPDRHRPRRAPDDPAAEPDVEPDPGVEGQAVGARPGGVALDRGERIALLVGRPDAGDQRDPSRPPGRPPGTPASIAPARPPPRRPRVDDDQHRAEGVRRAPGVDGPQRSARPGRPSPRAGRRPCRPSERHRVGRRRRSRRPASRSTSWSSGNAS